MFHFILSAAIAAAAVSGSAVESNTPKSKVELAKVTGVPESKSIGSDPITLKVEIDNVMEAKLQGWLKADDSKWSMKLSFDGLELPNNVGIKVFVNLAESASTPKGDSDHYLGMVSGFGPSDKKTYDVDLAPALRKLAAKKLWSPNDPITVRLVAAPSNPKLGIGDAIAKFEAIRVELPNRP